VARGWPALGVLLEAAARGATPAGRPFVAGAALGLFGLFAVAMLVRDAGWDRRAPRPLLLAIVLAAFAPLGAGGRP